MLAREGDNGSMAKELFWGGLDGADSSRCPAAASQDGVEHHEAIPTKAAEAAPAA